MTIVALDGQVSPSATRLIARAEQQRTAPNPALAQIINRDLPLGESSPGAVERAALLYRWAAEGRASRRARLQEAIEGLGRPATVLLTTVDAADLDALLRWLNQCDRNRLSVRQRCLVAALDEASAEAVDACRLRRIALEPPGGSVSPEAAASFVRALLLLECLENDVDVLLQPAAVVWWQDPIPWLEQGRGDVQLSSDTGSGRAFPIFGNPRFCFVRAHRRCRAAWETILGNFAWLLDRGDERPLVNRVLGHLVAHNLLDVRVLSEACFAPGGEVPQRGDAESIIVSIGS